MSPSEVLDALRRAGIMVMAREGRLHLYGAPALLAADLVLEARRQRGAILGLVLAEKTATQRAGQTDCNTATVPPKTGQPPEETEARATVAVRLAPPLHCIQNCNGPTDGRAGVSLPETGPRVLHFPQNCNTPAIATATPITSQASEEKRAESGDRCSVAVDSDGPRNREKDRDAAIYLESLALTWEMLDTCQGLADASPATDRAAWEAAHARYQRKAAAVKVFGATLPEPERRAFHADLKSRLWSIHDAWKALHEGENV